MKAAALLLLGMAACSSPGPSAPPAGGDDLAFELGIASQLGYDPAALKVGDFVLYSVRVDPTGQTNPYKWSVVGEEPGALWMENRRPPEGGHPGPMIVKSKVDRGGKVLEVWIGAPGGTPVKYYPRAGQPAEPPPSPRRDSSAAQAQTKEEVDRLSLVGKTYVCTKVTSTLSYPDGRKSVLTNWFSKEVPFAASKAYGGLVRRRLGRFTMELVTFGTNAQPELPLPK
jgi:hypothetical protein